MCYAFKKRLIRYGISFTPIIKLNTPIATGKSNATFEAIPVPIVVGSTPPIVVAGMKYTLSISYL
jgi:hypothetical protein